MSLHRRGRGAVLRRLGERTRLLVSGCAPPPCLVTDEADDRLVGVVMLISVGVGAVAPLIGAAALLYGLVHVSYRRRAAEQRRRDAVLADLPLAVDLLSVGVHGGATVVQALDALHGRLSGPVGAAFTRAADRQRSAWLLADTLDELLADLGDPVRPLAHVLLAASRDGDPLLPSLERLAAELHVERRRRAEVAARRLSVRLLIPLVVCVLPAFALLTVAPLAVVSLRSLPRMP